VSYEIRLRAYTPGTDTVLGLLPSPLSWEASVVHNNDGALTLKVSALADGGAILSRTLNQGLDVALEVNTTGAPDGWVEPDNCRFLMIDRKRDQTDPAKVLELSLVSWSWLLNKICDLNTGALQGSKSKYAGQRLFAATSDAGDVCKKMLDEHDARSGPAVPIVRSSWTTTKDSLGNNWAKKLGRNSEGRAFPAGQPLHAKLDALTTNGKCDWRTRGRGLRIYNPGTAFTDRSATVTLRYGDDLSEAPSQTSQADRVARILVKGDGKHKATEIDPSVPEFYGRWEAMLDCSGVKDDDDLQDAGEAELANRNRIKGQYTRELTMAGKYLPFRDYNVGDFIKAPGDSGDEVLRVMQITVTRSEGKLGGNVVLGDRFTNKDLSLASKVSAISGGSSGVSGNGTSATPPAEDTRQAEAPAGFTASGSLVLGADRRWSVNLAASWAAVTTATDGSALDVSGYKLMAQPAGGEWRELTRTAAASLMLSGFAQGSAWTFAVQAIPETAKWESPWSTQVAVTFPADTTAPNKPSAPVVESQPSTVSVTWDGLDYLGGAMPGDFDRVDVLMGTTNPPTEVVAQMPAGGQYVALAEIHSTVWVSLVAYDTTGNYSAATTPVSVVVKSVLDDTDLADRLATAPRFYTSPDHEPPATGIPAMSWWLKADGTAWQYVSGAWVAQANAVTGSVTAAQVLALLMAAASATIGDLSADAATIQAMYAQAFTAATAAIGLVKADRIVAGALDAYTITGVIIDGGTITGGTINGGTINGATFAATGADGTVRVQVTSTSSTALSKMTPSWISVANSNDIVGGSTPANNATLRGNGLVLTGSSAGYHAGSLKLNDDATRGYGLALASDTALELSSGSDTVNTAATNLKSVAPFLFFGTKATTDRFYYLPETTTSAANAFWSSVQANGYRRLQVNTSVRDAKGLIQDLDATPEAVLELRPRTWFDRGEMVEAGLDPDAASETECLAAGLRRVPGFIADEVEQVDPRFVSYDNEWLDDGVDGVAARQVLRGVAYDRISAALLVLAKSQQQQIETLTGQLASIESRLAAIGA